MIFQFLGTSAAEQYPDIWCQCPNCRKAREIKGRNIRCYSSAYLSPDILIDFPPAINAQASAFDVPLFEIKYLIVTHSHADHFCPSLLKKRNGEIVDKNSSTHSIIRSPFLKLPELNVFGNEKVCNDIKKVLEGEAEEKYKLSLHVVEPFGNYKVDDLLIVPLKANHRITNEVCLNYILQKDARTILYALDSSLFLPESWDVIRKFKYDLVVLDGTEGEVPVLADNTSGGGHLNFNEVKNIYRTFQDEGLLNKGSCFTISHLSPHWCPTHEDIAPQFAELGITVAYDGMKISFK